MHNCICTGSEDTVLFRLIFFFLTPRLTVKKSAELGDFFFLFATQYIEP